MARLLIDQGRVVTADRLIEDLWRGEPPDSARHALHVYVSRLRKSLGHDGARLEHHGAGYRFSVEADELDASRFEQLATEGRAALARHDTDQAIAHLRKALSMWRGAALTEFADEAFAREEAVRLDELRLTTLEQRLWAELELDGDGNVVEELQALVAQHPFRESFWEQLMLALYRSGRQAEALRTYQRARASLAEELGIEPGPALRQMEERILAQDPSLELALGAVSDGPPRQLPLLRTSFVGREPELSLGAELLDRSRLLTLTGAPGSGKTRLALRLAIDHESQFLHGTFFVPLAAVTNPRLIDTTIARVLGLRETPGESAWGAVQAFLRDRVVLLILDNFEQIIRSAPRVGELIDAAPGLTIMVTSRSPLGLSGEQEFPVPPLRVPSVDDLPGISELATYDAVALFVARSRAADPNFGLNAENAAAVAAITAGLDGLPLAIELAAARIKLLTPQDLLGRLERRLTLLTEGPADTADRHRTMRDAIAWSHELLEPDEQALFRRLGVFLGGFTLEAAAAVADLPDENILDGVSSLLAQSLLHRPVDVGQARFAMLEMMREFAMEELASAGEEKKTAGRHARYFLRLAEEIEPQLSQEPQGVGMKRLSSDLANLRGALRHFLESGNPDLGLRLASSIWRFWQSSDQLNEGREWLDSLLAHPKTSDGARAQGLTAFAGLAYWQAEYDQALARYEEALDLYRAADDQVNEADTLYSMSLTANWKGDLDAGERFADEAQLAFEKLGTREGIGRAIMARAFVLWRRNDLAAARDLWEEGLVISRETGDMALAITQLVGLASLTFHLGDPEEAMRIVLDGVREATELQNAHVTVWMLDFVAAFAASSAPEASVRLAGAVDALRQEAGGGILPESLDVVDARSATAHLLSSADSDRAWAQGRGLSLQEAAAEARQLGAILLEL